MCRCRKQRAAAATLPTRCPRRCPPACPSTQPPAPSAERPRSAPQAQTYRYTATDGTDTAMLSFTSEVLATPWTGTTAMLSPTPTPEPAGTPTPTPTPVSRKQWSRKDARHRPDPNPGARYAVLGVGNARRRLADRKLGRREAMQLSYHVTYSTDSGRKLAVSPVNDSYEYPTPTASHSAASTTPRPTSWACAPATTAATAAGATLRPPVHTSPPKTTVLRPRSHPYPTATSYTEAHAHTD